MDNIRVSELAKELGLTSKEVLEKFAQISINVKSHSNTVTALQVSKLKDFIAGGSKVPSKKPKAFIVKKAKPKAEEAPAVETKQEETEQCQNSGNHPVKSVDVEGWVIEQEMIKGKINYEKNHHRHDHVSNDKKTAQLQRVVAGIFSGSVMVKNRKNIFFQTPCCL